MDDFTEALTTVSVKYKTMQSENLRLKNRIKELEETIAAMKQIPKYYSVAEVARTLKCSSETIYRAIRTGRIAAGSLSAIENSRNCRKLIPASELPKLLGIAEN